MFKQAGFGNLLVLILVGLSLIVFGYFFTGRIAKQSRQNVAGAHTEASLFSFLRNLFIPRSNPPTINSTPLPTALPFASTAPLSSSDHYGNHLFIFTNLPTSTKAYLIDSAARSGKKLIRTGFDLTSIEYNEGVFTWNSLDEIVKMSTEKGLTIVGGIGYSAPWIAAPGAAKPYQGPIDPNKLDKYVEYVKATVSHFSQITYWEVWNEPDEKGLYDSDPAGFAKILALSYQAIKQTNPNALVLFPGVIYAPGEFTKAVLTDPQYPGSQNYDIANFHDRAPLAELKAKTINSVNIFNTYGKKGAPVWVTEHGYPSNPRFQNDPNYKGTDATSGEQAQADFYKVSLPLILSLGVDKVFISRDANNYHCNISPDASRFCSEGLVTFPFSPGTGRDKLSFAVFQAL